jgi:coenzyme F420-dependent glucose-6-phosphate dehydrogenase
MCQIAYHASHEQFAPSHLLRLAVGAQRAGFDAIHSSDHFYPWSERQGQSGHSLSWLGAAMQATTLPFSVVCAPGPRHHPAVLAQAIATLAEMFPGRFSIELGSGEALNESITGEAWPPKEQRNERLYQSAGIIRKLLRGEEVTDHGIVKTKEARLYTLPAQAPPVFGAAITEATARWCGQWADGLLTTASKNDDPLKKIQAFRQEAGPEKPVYVQFAFSFHPDHEEALKGAHDQWRCNLLSPDVLANFYKPAHFDKASEHVTLEQIEQQVLIYTSATALFKQIDYLARSGASRVILHNVNRHQELFLQHFGLYKECSRLKTGLENL